MLANAAARLGLRASRGAATAVTSAPHVLDWSALTAQLTSDEAKREVSKLKKTVEDVREQLAAQSKEPEPIDFAAFRKELSGAPGVVDAFEKAYNALTFPKYEGKEDEEYLAKMAGLQKEAAAAEASARARIVELEAELKALALEKASIKTLTVDAALAADPKLAEEINKELLAGKWY